MKKMTCKQLGGACNLVFRAETFDEIAEMSRNHGLEMYEAQDEAHLEAMNNMQKLMRTQELMMEWMEGKRKEFEDLPDYHLDRLNR